MAPGAPNLSRAVAWAMKNNPTFLYEEVPALDEEAWAKAELEREFRRERSLRARLGRRLRPR